MTRHWANGKCLTTRQHRAELRKLRILCQALERENHATLTNLLHARQRPWKRRIALAKQIVDENRRTIARYETEIARIVAHLDSIDTSL